MAKQSSTRSAAGGVRRSLARAFPRLSGDQTAAVAKGARTKKYANGETVFREGSYANGFYVVIRGQAQVSQLNDKGNDVKLAKLGPGDFFGEIGLLTQPRRTATVRAMTALEIVSLDRDQFVALMQASPLTAATVRAAGDKRQTRKPAAKRAPAAKTTAKAKSTSAARTTAKARSTSAAKSTSAARKRPPRTRKA